MRVDRQKERMTGNAMRKMGTYEGLPLVLGHGGWRGRYALQGDVAAKRIGTVERCQVEGGLLVVRGVLDQGSLVATRVQAEVAAGRRYALSVGGRVTAAHWARDNETGEMVRHIDDVELDHVAVCSREAAVNPDTSLGLVGGHPDESSVAATEAASEAVTAKAGEDEQIMRLRGVLGRAWRSLKPAARVQDAEGLREMLDQVATEVDALRAQMRELGEMRKARLEPAVAGASRCLPGQETHKGDPWRGVL